MRSIRKCRASFSVLSGGSEKLRWRTPADPGCRPRAVARGHEQGRTRCTGPEAMAALPCCSAARTTASRASGRAAVQPGDLLYPIGVYDEVLYVLGRMRIRQIIPVGEDRALLQETLAQHGPWRSWPRPAPSRSSPASREPISRSTARCRRDLAAPDLPVEAGPAGPSRQRRRPPPPLDRRAVHLPAGRILRSRSASHPGRTAQRADSPVPGTQTPGHTRRHRTLF
jgi:hypothetical protein